MLRGVAVGGLVAGVRVGKATGVVYLPGLGFMWFFSPGGVGHWAPNLHLRLTLLNKTKFRHLFNKVTLLNSPLVKKK